MFSYHCLSGSASGKASPILPAGCSLGRPGNAVHTRGTYRSGSLLVAGRTAHTDTNVTKLLVAEVLLLLTSVAAMSS